MNNQYPKKISHPITITNKKTLNLISGGISGVSQLIIGHPIDSLKTWKQNTNCKFTFSLKNVGGLYLGISYPLISNLINNSILFTNYNRYKERSFLANILPQYPRYLTVGMLSGLISSPLIYLFDYSKVNKQMNSPSQFFSINREKFEAYPISAFRSMLGYGLYFSSYDYYKNNKNLHPIMAGGFAGMTNWGITFPLDSLKSRQIYYSISLQDAWKFGGETFVKRLFSLYSGYGLMMFRAFPTNALGFYTYQTLYDYLSEKN